jgi:inhibitor of KinA
MSDYKVLPAGDTALVVEFGDRVDRKLSVRVLSLARALDQTRLDGIIETVPTYRSLMVHYDPFRLSATSLTAAIAKLNDDLPTNEGIGRTWRIPACYDASIAPDLDYVASECRLTPSQVIELHSETIYHVYMIGFMPGFAYLGDIPAELVLPRRLSPRQRVPSGSLAIATTMTCIYPDESPGGWHLIGKSPVELLKRWPTPVTLLAPGDQVMFAPISLHEYQRLLEKAARGILEIIPNEGLFINAMPATLPIQR